jgi:hypothetical protein
MLIPDPNFYPSRIPDPKTATKERDDKKIFVKHFFVATIFTKCKIILFLNCSGKKFGPNFKDLWNFLPKKFGIRDPRSGINPFRIPDPGVKKAPDPGSGSATLYSCLFIQGADYKLGQFLSQNI